MTLNEMWAIFLAALQCIYEAYTDPYDPYDYAASDPEVALLDIPDYLYDDILSCLVPKLVLIEIVFEDNPDLETSLGDDVVLGGALGEIVNGYGGDDVVDLGGGRNIADLGSGNDLAVVVWSEVPDDTLASRYDGGSGDDTVRAVLNAEEAQDEAVLADLLALREGQAAGLWIEPVTLNAQFRDFENLEIVAPVLALDDVATTSENAFISFNVLDNDLDLLADVEALASNNDALRVTGVSVDTLRAGARLTIGPDGTLRFNPGTAYDDLGAGETASVRVTYQVADDQGLSDTATARITVTGKDDPALVTGKTSANLYEDRVVRTVGAIAITDPDDAPTFARASASGTYGEMTVNGQGTAWTYKLDNASPQVQRLAGGQVVRDVLTLTASDGSTQKVTLTIRGTNDPATSSGRTGLVTEDGDADLDPATAQTVTGHMVVNDVDAGEGTLRPQSAAKADHGTFDIAANGRWTYTLDNEDEAVQALDAGETLRDSLTVVTDDGTTQRLTVTIAGADDAPPVPAVVLGQVARGRGGFLVDGFATDARIADDVSIAGDVNGDGFADLIVSESGAGPNGTQSGQAYLVFGKADVGRVDLADIEDGASGFAINGVQRFDGAGASVRDAGDVNGDGLADLFVGAPSRDNGRLDVGRAYVVFGKTGDETVELADIEAGEGGFSIVGLAQQQKIGGRLASGGDINGDGLADLIVSDPDAHGGTGVAYVVFGKADGSSVRLADIEDGDGGFVIRGINAGDAAGMSIDTAGDVNGDGREDVVLTAPGRGSSYVVFGKANRQAVDLADVTRGEGGFVIRPGLVDGEIGQVAGAGDVNGDGLADVVLGVEDAAPNGRASGSSFVVFGKQGTESVALSQIAKGEGGFAIHGAERGDRAGLSLSSAGDTNADGLDDLVIGADPASADGAAYVVYGQSGGEAIELADVGAGVGGFVIRGNGADDSAGTVVSGGADINGDGLADVVVGAPGDSAGADSRSYVVFGQFVSAERAVQRGDAGDNSLLGTGSNDALFGAAGDDRLLPRGGSDLVAGGQGNDTIIVTRPDAMLGLTVVGFERGPGAGDVLELSALGFDTFADLMDATAASGPDGRDTAIAVSPSVEIVLRDFEQALLSPDDVIL